MRPARGARGDPADPAAARLKALSYLARRDYGRRALELKLERAGFKPGARATALDGLETEGFLNEARTVESAVRARIGRGQGPVRILAELSREALPRALLEAAVGAKDPVWAERATALRRRRFGAAPTRTTAERARQGRFLRQRGFTLAQIRAALGAADEEEPDGAPDEDLEHVDSDY
jgi:regulatory protein